LLPVLCTIKILLKWWKFVQWLTSCKAPDHLHKTIPHNIQHLSHESYDLHPLLGVNEGKFLLYLFPVETWLRIWMVISRASTLCTSLKSNLVQLYLLKTNIFHRYKWTSNQRRRNELGTIEDTNTSLRRKKHEHTWRPTFRKASRHLGRQNICRETRHVTLEAQRLSACWQTSWMSRPDILQYVKQEKFRIFSRTLPSVFSHNLLVLRY
jgi:hypothetical protein